LPRRRVVRAALVLPLLAALTAPLVAPGATGAQGPGVFDPNGFGVALTPVVDGFEQPLWVTAAPDGSGRLFVVEQPGRVRIVRDGVVAERPFLDIVDRVESGGSEQGLLSIAFHPDFAENGLFYVYYTARGSDAGVGDNTIARYRVSAEDPDRGDPASEEILLAVEDPYPNHNGGLLLFGPDGYLYAGLGDGGSSGDPQGNGQDRGTLLGAILRLDVDPARVTAEEPYLIPEDNPFVGEPDARPEIWAYGLRNPWRFSFDRATGELFIADVGQNRYEEVNYQPADSAGGENYGWNLREGRHCFAEDDCTVAGLVDPVAEYDHDLGNSVTGGYVYRGQAHPDLVGTYLYADFGTGLLWGLGRDEVGAWVASDPVETGLNISSFGEDAAGELYATAFDGTLYSVSGPAS
jgi:glucose/arabinose dehydrogenase